MKYDICVFGGCSLDQMFYQNVDGTFGETPSLKVQGGKGANQAVAASRAGANVVMLSRIGKDEIGKNIIDNLAYNGIKTSFIEVVDGLENDYSNIYIKLKDKDYDIERFGKAIDSFYPEMVEKYSEVILNSKIIVCQLKCPIETTEKLIDFCHKHDKPIILTPCRPNKLTNRLDLVDKISLITCNEKECKTIFETEDIEECIKRYPNKLIVTLGKDGLIYHNGTRIVKMPSLDVNVLDTTGAGDTLCGNLAALLAKGSTLRHALRKATYASSMKIQVKSAQEGMPYKEELEEYIANVRNKKFAYNDELNLAIKIIKEAYEKIQEIKNFKINARDDNTIVTSLDLALEKYLTTKIRENFPNDNFLTEESYNNNNLQDRTWVIDPIDGTAHFIKNSPFWGMQLAFFDKNSTKFSVIYMPMEDKLYYAAENQGAYVNNNRIFPNKTMPLNQSVIEFAGSFQKESSLKKEYLNKLYDKEQSKVLNILYINSSSYSFTNLAIGRTDAMIISTAKEWDTLPGMCLIKELGISSYPMDFQEKLTLVTNNEDIKKLLLK